MLPNRAQLPEYWRRQWRLDFYRGPLGPERVALPLRGAAYMAFCDLC